MANVFGAEFRRVDHREYLGKPALAAVAIRSYDTAVEDLWEAITTPARLARWFGSIEGELKLGGRYAIAGNASGTITHCEPPKAIDLTWEYAGTMSWVTVRLERDGRKTRLTLEHIAHKDGTGPAAEHFKQFGPAATGVGWDLWLYGLERHLSDPAAALDHAAAEAWTQSAQGRAFVRASGEAWGTADAASGENPEEARARAERTIAFYTGA